MHLTILCSFFLCVFVWKCVWAESVATFIIICYLQRQGQVLLLSYVMSSIDVSEEKLGLHSYCGCTSHRYACMCTIFILLSLFPRPRELMIQITAAESLVVVFLILYLCGCVSDRSTCTRIWKHESKIIIKWFLCNWINKKAKKNVCSAYVYVQQAHGHHWWGICGFMGVLFILKFAYMNVQSEVCQHNVKVHWWRQEKRYKVTARQKRESNISFFF